MTDIETELAHAFAEASDFIEAPVGLASRVRRAARRRRQMTLAALTACALVLAAAGLRYAATGNQNDGQANVAPRLFLSLRASISQLVAGPRMLYLVTNPPNSGPTEKPIRLQAYDLATGKLVSQLRLTAAPSSLVVGKGGLVWLAFPGQSGAGRDKPARIWLLNADLTDLSQTSALSYGADILPTGRTTALTVTPGGVDQITMPAPGQAGQARITAVSHTRLGSGATGVNWAGWLDGKVAAERFVSRGSNTSHDDLTIAGEPSLQFGGATRVVHSVASDGSSLWVVSPRPSDLTCGGCGAAGFPLIRLDSRLRVTTPEFVQTEVNNAQQVWSDSETVWVSSYAPPFALACFAAASRNGPVRTIRLGAEPVALAPAGDTVFVSTATPEGDHVISYPVPTACR
jgi:hypothetical protein